MDDAGTRDQKQQRLGRGTGRRVDVWRTVEVGVLGRCKAKVVSSSELRGRPVVARLAGQRHTGTGGPWWRLAQRKRWWEATAGAGLRSERLNGERSWRGLKQICGRGGALLLAPAMDAEMLKTPASISSIFRRRMCSSGSSILEICSLEIAREGLDEALHVC